MKRLNRRGFTLIELMAVLAVLVIIMGIALPNITSSIERSKQKQKDAKIELLTSAAELYFDRHSSLNKISGVRLESLISDQGIPGIEMEEVCDSGNCCVKYNSSNYKYEFKDSNSDCRNAS